MLPISTDQHDVANLILLHLWQDVCGKAVGVSDYIALCQTVHTLIVMNVPQMHMGVRDKARRFINLIDQVWW